jgi:ribosomal protein S4E
MFWRRQKTPTLPSPKPEPLALPVKPVVFPSGIVVHTPSGYFLINKDGKKYRITSDAVLESWNFSLIVETSDAAISKYPIALTKLGFRDGSLLINIADGRMYVASEQTLRHVTTTWILDILGVTVDDFKVVSDDEINLMRQGANI